MAKQPELYTDPLTGVENDPYAGTVNPRTGLNPAAQSGTDALRAGLVDQAFTQQPAAMYSQFELPTGLSTPPSSYGLPSLESLMQPARSKIRLGYDREQGKYLINNTVVDVRDIETLERVPELLQQPSSPETPAGNWQPISLQTLKQNKDALLDISIGERIGFGARDVAGSIPAGFGRLAEFAGAERLGGALVGLGERLETDEFDQARQAAVAESENIFQSIAGAVPQGLPSVIASVGSSVLGGAIGGAAAGPIGVAIGAIIGGASTIFPMMVNSAYDTALQQQGEDFVNSSQGRAEILGTAMATTGIQMIPGMQVTGKVVPAVMQRAATQVANKATSGIAGEAAKIGFSEGMAEMMALVIEQVAFDPETRAMMSEGEVQAMLPYVIETYGREAAVAFAAGAILGGGIGAVTGAVTRRAPSEETNLLEPEEGPTPTEPAEPTTGGPLVPTATTPSGPEFQQPIRGTGPQGVLPMGGLGGQIERARRSRAVGYQPPRTGEQTNLLDRPPTAQGEPQLSLDLQEPTPMQGELFPAPGAQRLRRGVQAVENLVPPTPPIEAGPTQRELFTRRGLPTAAARAATLPQPESGAVFGRVDGSPFRTEVSALGQRKRVARETGIPVNELEVVETDGGFFLTRAGEETIAPETSPVDILFEKVETEREVKRASREKLISMPIDDFLAMAKEGRPEPQKVKRVDRFISEGKPFPDLPFLNFKISEDGVAEVTGHEGRHRARKLKELGYTHIPVLLKAPNTPMSLRWSEQNRPTSSDYVENFPTILRSEDGQIDIAFPVTREQSDLPYVDTTGVQDAIQEPSPAAVPAREPAAVSPETVATGPAGSLIDTSQYVYHAVRNDSDINDIMQNGLNPGTNISGSLDGQAFSGEGDTILVLRREDVKPRDKDYQADSLTTSAARPIAIIKDTSVEAKPSTKTEVEDKAIAAQKELDSLAIYAQTEYGLSDLDVMSYAVGIKNISEAPVEAQSLMKRLRVISNRIDTLLDRAEAASDTGVSADEVLAQYTQYGLPVQQVVITPADDGTQTVTLGREAQTQEQKDAIQEPSPETVPAREPTGVSEEVGARVPSVQEPARAREEDIIQQAQEADQEQVVQEDVVLSSDADFVNDLIGIIDTTKDTTLYEESITTLLDWGHNADSNNKRAGLDRLAFEYLNELPVDNSVRNAVLKFARYQSKQIPATTTNGEFTPTFEFILRARMFDTIYKRFGFARLPDNMRPADKEIAKNVETNEPVSTDKGFENAEALSREINRINSLVGRTRTDTLENYRKNLTELYTKVVENGQQDFEVDPVRQTTLADYFLADGSPRIIERDGRAIVSPTEGAEAAPRILTDFSEWDRSIEDPTLRTFEEIERGEDRLRARAGAPTTSIEDDFLGFGMFSTLDGDPITKPMEMGKVRMQVNVFRNKLRVKPKTFVFRTQADLQAKNPELYQRAVDARPQGDFDTRLAAGYSFGTGADATVLIFSDRIKNTDHLNFVLAHETLGHFGFRSILPARDYNKFMVDIYNESGPTSALVQEVDAAMNANPDLSLAEAVEEYLADYAAQLDVSLIGRIINFIKRALNKLGIKYPDDAARYLVDQSKRYVRNGNRSSMFVTSEVLSRVRAIELGEDPDGTGRFAPTTTLSEANIAASFLDIVPEGAQDKARDFFRKVKMNTPEDLDAFKNSLFNLFVFRARENEGLSEVHDIIKRSRGLAMSLRRKHQEKLAVVLDRAVMDKLSNVRLLGGATKAQVDTVNRFLYAGLQAKLSEFSPKDLGTDSLFTLDSNGNYVENSTEINRLFNMGNLTLAQMRDGFTYVREVEEAGKTVTKTETVEGVPGLTEDSIEWKGYIAAREVMRDVELELLKTKLNAFTEERAATFTELGLDMVDNQLSPQARQFLERIYQRYSEIYTAGSDIDESGGFIFADDAMSRSNEFIKAINTAVIAKERSADDTVAAERNAEVAKFFPNIPPQEIDAAIEAFKAERKQTTNENRYTLQTAFKNLVTQELADEQSNLYVRSNLAQGYIPLRRRGNYQVRVEAFDEDGNRVVLRKEYKNQLVYKQVETIGDATKLSNVINEAFKGQTFPVEIYNEATNQFEIKEVTLKASASVVKNASSAPPNINLNDFTTGLRRFSINVPPAQMANIIKELTRQNDNARNKLKRELVPGFDGDALRAVAEHVESRASVIAKTAMAPRLLEITNTRLEQTKKKWEGDEEKLANLKARLDATLENPNATEGDIKAARRDYNRYLYMFNKTRPANGVNMGNKYFNEMSGLLQFIQNNEDINESDFARGPVVSAIRASTSVMQLGGSIATGALNYMALYTNYLPYMFSYNEKNGFGGGFAFGEVNRELFRAMNKVGLAKSIGDTRLNTAEFYDQIAQSKALQDQFDLTAIEATFMATEIREGVMIPAQINMLTELALGRIKKDGVRRVIEGYMWTFNATERATRRAAGLAAFRLEFKRRMESGMSEAQAAEFARQFAVEAIDVSLGDYAVTNRPAAWRSGWQSFLYIYKIFPTTSIQMFSRLPRDGQLKMLTTLWFLSGVAGLPFAEDLEDMVDTIAQTLGWNMGSIRLEAAKLSDAIIPGSSPIVLSGFMRSFITPDIASRTSLGDFIPGTAVFLAGSNTTREIQEIAGPAASMITGVGTALVTALRAATTEQVTFEDVLRSGPITGGRMLGDTMAYLRSGAVVDKRGYVVTPEMGWSTVASRLLGFYPSAAADQYEVIRVSKRLNDYQREVSAGFRYGWIKAKIAGDERQARAIEEAVREWNEGARGSALEIRNFKKNAVRALREARRPATERLRKSAPIAAREDMDRVADLIGY